MIVGTVRVISSGVFPLASIEKIFSISFEGDQIFSVSILFPMLLT
jgi:hypothetical protein